MKFKFITFENTPENAREILANMGQNIDVIAGVFDETMLKLRGCDGTEISREPFCVAVSIHHRLAKKEKIMLDDLAGENLMLMRRGWSYYSDLLRDDMIENHPEINIVDFDLYNVEAFNRCENNNEVLLAFKSWERRHMNGLAWQCLCFFWHTIY
ncbi:LysR substrate-binding domain-containing protein [Thermoguttaceae bacterium LCP21S3_D4]